MESTNEDHHFRDPLRMRKQQFGYDIADMGIAGDNFSAWASSGFGQWDPELNPLSNPRQVQRLLMHYKTTPKGVSFLADRQRPHKTKLRNDAVLRVVSLARRPIRVFSMPGICWSFEEQLLAFLEPIGGRRVIGGTRSATNTRLYCIEWSPHIYRAALASMPGHLFRLRAHTPWRLQTGAIAEFRKCAFEDFPDRLLCNMDAAWVDFCGQLTERRLVKLRRLRDAAVLIITWMDSRGKIPGYPSQGAALEAALGKPRQLIRYRDSAVTMCHAIFDSHSDSGADADLCRYF